ncbi:hypothetical protein QFZ72_005344 [Bacillus sp. V2I10]|nr:hypothetical protein [Bacillus sp. V2I10]
MKEGGTSYKGRLSSFLIIYLYESESALTSVFESDLFHILRSSIVTVAPPYPLLPSAPIMILKAVSKLFSPSLERSRAAFSDTVNIHFSSMIRPVCSDCEQMPLVSNRSCPNIRSVYAVTYIKCHAVCNGWSNIPSLISAAAQFLFERTV